MRTVFTSKISFEDAAQKAQAAGFRVTGQAKHKSQFVVFGDNKNNKVNVNPLWGKI